MGDESEPIVGTTYHLSIYYDKLSIMRPQIIAFYLPQFHTIPENDEWWGKGFTDWVNVKKSKPLFKGHLQPRVPENGYYDLADVEVMRTQADMARKYGLSGFCFYHYWFAGKLLLEKPAAQLLEHPDIDMPYCFSWANEPWARTWDGKARQVLMPQAYGAEEDWRKHFDYLLPFFQDQRYMKHDGAPVFLIYKSRSIPRCGEMMQKWIAWAQEAGLAGIHFVQTIRERQLDQRELPFSAQVEFEPARSIHQQSALSLQMQRVRRLAINIYNKVSQKKHPTNARIPFKNMAHISLSNNSPKGTYGGVFAGWDNSPRRGENATIILPPTKQEFAEYLRAKLRQTREVYGTNTIFVNAWNEWAEGTYLEPDTELHYSYLEAIREVVDSCDL